MKGKTGDAKIFGAFLIVIGLYSVATGNSSGWILIGFGLVLFFVR